MLRCLQLILRTRFYKLALLGIAAICLVSFFTFDGNVKGKLPSKSADDKDVSIVLMHILKRLDKLEKSFSHIQSLPKQKKLQIENHIQVEQPKLIKSNKCTIPSNWRYPFCNEKVQWMRLMWQGNANCYMKTHDVNPTDDCTILRFLSEAEAWCPILPGREKPDPLLSRPKANLRTNITGLMELLKAKYYEWMRDRINQYWFDWLEGLFALKRRKPDLDDRPSRNILVFLGSFAFEPLFFTYAYKGGPLGELVQWSDLLTTLYILGDNITLSAKEKDLDWLLNIPKGKDCATRARDDEFDVIYTDYNGLRYMALHLGPNHSQYRCKVIVIDSFGTEAEFNFAEYSQPIIGGRSPWANADLNLRQIMTMFPHSPDNTFLGFVVDRPPSVTKAKSSTGKPIGLVYGKEARFWKGKRAYLNILHKYFEIHATLGEYGGGSDASHIPEYVVNHGILKGADLQELLKKAKVFIGLGFPYEGPAPLEAIACGCIFINARLDPPQNRLNNHFFKLKPTFRALTSQHPYTEEFIGEPYVFTVDISNKTAVRIAAKKILKTEVQPYLPLEWTPEGMLERMNSYIKNLDFCTKNSKIWPPKSENKLIKGQLGASCKDACMEKGLICEPFFFHDMNKQDSFNKLDIGCTVLKNETIVDAPSYTPKDNSCTLQNHPLAFSCVAKNPNKVRLCPCRDFQPQQVAFCKNCS